ncbi:cysteine-rich receptor-like protein kinase 8 [Tanacetum coccineum]
MAPANNNQNMNNRNQNTSNNQPPPRNNQPPPTGSQISTIDINSPNHPLYLHPNDHAGLILILKKLAGSENYSSWKRSMMIALSAKNKLKIITYQISNNLNFVNSTSELWSDLYEHYAQLDGHRMYQLVNDIVALKQQNYNIEVYYHKLKGLWDEHDTLEAPYLCNCVCNCENGKNNGDREQRKRPIQFLMGLDECYLNLRGHILLLQPLSIVAKAYSMIRQEEKQMEGILPKPLGSTTLSAQTYLNQTDSTTQTETPTLNFQIDHNLEETHLGLVYTSQIVPRKDTTVMSVIGLNATQLVIHYMKNTNHQCSAQAESSTSAGNDAVFVRMDQLKNQPNQVLLMMLQCQKEPPSGNHLEDVEVGKSG